MTRPTDLPEVRQAMLEHYVSDWGQAAWLAVAKHSGFLGRPAADAEAELSLRHEVQRWAQAELFYVTEDMTALAAEAAKSMPTFTLDPSDLPAEYGLLYFAGPIGESLADEEGRPPIPIVACLWGKMSVPADPEGKVLRPGVWLSFYTDAKAARDEAMRFYGDDPAALDRLLANHAHRGPLIYDDEAVLLFGSEDVPEHVTAKASRYYLVRCAWLMMQQQVAAVETERPERATRRRLARAGVRESTVRVVRLRHAASVGQGDGSRDYRHRWIVRGHWRKQWYPSQERHVPIWIQPHVKGPDGAPLLGGEKVYVWER